MASVKCLKRQWERVYESHVKNAWIPLGRIDARIQTIKRRHGRRKLGRMNRRFYLLMTRLTEMRNEQSWFGSPFTSFVVSADSLVIYYRGSKFPRLEIKRKGGGFVTTEWQSKNFPVILPEYCNGLWTAKRQEELASVVKKALKATLPTAFQFA